jgi:uncharacterized repeat protein (TIGR03803 family)
MKARYDRSEYRNVPQVIEQRLGLPKLACVVFVFCAAMTTSSPAQTLSTLVSFNGTDGKYPVSVIQGTDGNFYGLTFVGGAYGGCSEGCGTVFQITPAGSLTTLHSFNGSDGALPLGSLVQATDGDFYGTTLSGGAYGYGTVFKSTAGGTLTTLHSFCDPAYCAEGYSPSAGLIQATDGNFYGTTKYGGTYGVGTVFEITPQGTLTTLHSFDGTDGDAPISALVQGADGNFYGTTNSGGANNAPTCTDGDLVGCGTLFKMTATGTLTTLYNFCSQTNCTDGAQPFAGLIQGTDGNFYGTTYGGGAFDNCFGSGCGTVFKLIQGTLTTLYSFKGTPDGALPLAGLAQGTDGNFYGTTAEAGAHSWGTVFKITSSGTETTLYSFCSQANCADGSYSIAGLIQGTDGSFYGTTYGEPTNNDGTVFRIAPTAIQFVAVTPCRLVDTRPQGGGSGPIQGGTFETFDLPGLAQNRGCGNLSSAATYSLNVTLIPSNGPVGYLTIWPAGETQPYVSTMNSDGRIKANAAIVQAGVSGGVNVYVTDTANVVLDIDSYFAPGSNSTLEFYPLTPCRVADTRFPPGDLGGPYLTGGVERDFPVLESYCIPAGVTPAAYSFNLTAIPHGPLGYLTVWPYGQTQPDVSTLNAPTGTVTANAAILPAGNSGEISTWAYNDTDLVIDINGYFAMPGQGGLSLNPLVPCRVLDTRNGNGAFSGTLNPPVNVLGSPCSLPSQSQTYVVNATVVPVGSLGYLTLWPDGEQQPNVSTLNAYDGAVTSNMAIVPAGNQGKIDAYAYGTTNLILDISGYFAP